MRRAVVVRLKPGLCLFIAFFAACASTKSSAPAASSTRPASHYFPLTLGTAWEYEASMLGQKRPLAVSIVRVSGGVAEDSMGAKLQADAWGVRDEKRYLLRDPVTTGTVWNNVVSPSSVEHYEIVGTEQPCSAPAGHWEGCVVVEARNRIDQTKTLINEWTLAPQVGIVRMMTTLDDSGRRIPQSQLTLKTFRPARTEPETNVAR